MSEQSAAIGTVEASEGSVWVVRSDGSRAELENGDPVYQGDLIETDNDGAVGVTFTDGSAFSLGSNGEMTIDEMIYNPATQEGSSFFSVVQGGFSFVSGSIAKTTPDGMMVQTPVATIGVRGTKVVGEAGPEGSDNSFTLLREDDGTTGEIVVYNEGGIQVLNQPFQTVSISDPSAGVPDPVVISQEDVSNRYDTTLRALPAVDHGNATPQDGGDDGEESGPPLPGEAADGEETAEEELAAAEEEAAGPEILQESELEAGPEIEELPDLQDPTDAEDEEELSADKEQGLDEEIVGPQAPKAPPSTIAQSDATDTFGPGVNDDLPKASIDENLSPQGPSFNNTVGPDPIKMASIEDVIRAGLNAGFTTDQIFNALSTTSDGDSSEKAAEPVAGDDTLDGGSGNDGLIIVGDRDSSNDSAAEALTGTTGADIISGSDGADIISGEDGNDSLYAGSGDDTVDGGNGDDLITGGDGSDEIHAGAGNDTVYAGSGDDTVNGGDGDDLITGDNGADTIHGGAGNDTIYAGNSSDTINGGDGDDLITGDNGADTIYGGAGNDTIYAGNGSDFINGGAGGGTLSGGAGADTFQFSGSADGYTKTTNGAATDAELAEVAKIIDFETGNDKLSFDASGFSGISSLVDGLTAIRLHDVFDGTNVSNTTFQAGTPVLIYDDTGTFYYDANGAGDGYTIVGKVDGQVSFGDLELEGGGSV